MSDPGDKYSKLALPEYRMALDSVGMAYHVIAPHREFLQTMADAAAGMHSYLHITQPTLYRDAINSPRFSQNIELCNAALAFLKAAETAAPILMALAERFPPQATDAATPEKDEN